MNRAPPSQIRGPAAPNDNNRRQLATNNSFIMDNVFAIVHSDGSIELRTKDTNQENQTYTQLPPSQPPTNRSTTGARALSPQPNRNSESSRNSEPNRGVAPNEQITNRSNLNSSGPPKLRSSGPPVNNNRGNPRQNGGPSNPPSNSAYNGGPSNPPSNSSYNGGPSNSPSSQPFIIEEPIHLPDNQLYRILPIPLPILESLLLIDNKVSILIDNKVSILIDSQVLIQILRRIMVELHPVHQQLLIIDNMDKQKRMQEICQGLYHLDGRKLQQMMDILTFGIQKQELLRGKNLNQVNIENNMLFYLLSTRKNFVPRKTS